MQLRSTDLVSKKKNDPSSEFKWPAGVFFASFKFSVFVCGAVFFPNHLPLIDATCSRSDFCPIVSPIPMASCHC